MFVTSLLAPCPLTDRSKQVVPSFDLALFLDSKT